MCPYTNCSGHLVYEEICWRSPWIEEKFAHPKEDPFYLLASVHMSIVLSTFIFHPACCLLFVFIGCIRYTPHSTFYVYNTRILYTGN